VPNDGVYGIYFKNNSSSAVSFTVSTNRELLSIDQPFISQPGKSSDSTEAFLLSLLTENISVIQDNADLIIQMPTDSIPITIQGPSDEIRGIANSNLTALLDLSGFGVGIHDAALQLNLPKNVSAIDAPITIRVVITGESKTEVQ